MVKKMVVRAKRKAYSILGTHTKKNSKRNAHMLYTVLKGQNKEMETREEKREK